MSITVTRGLAIAHAPTCAVGSRIGNTIGIYTIVTVISKNISPTAKARLPLANSASRGTTGEHEFEWNRFSLLESIPACSRAHLHVHVLCGLRFQRYCADGNE